MLNLLEGCILKLYVYASIIRSKRQGKEPQRIRIKS